LRFMNSDLPDFQPEELIYNVWRKSYYY
jgi:hypothetical protein